MEKRKNEGKKKRKERLRKTEETKVEGKKRERKTKGERKEW